MESKKKGLDREMIVVCGLVALLVSISIIFFGCFMDGSGPVKMQQYDFSGSLFCIDWWNLGHTLMQKLLT